MEILNTYAKTMPACDAAARDAGLVMLHALTRDAAGGVAVYSGAVSRRSIDTPEGRAAAAEKVAFTGEKQTERAAGALFDLTGLTYRR